MLTFLENDSEVIDISGIDFARAYRNVDNLFDCMHYTLTRFEYSPGYYEMLNNDCIDHPSSDCASWETFRQIMIKHFGITTVYELLTDNEDEIEQCCQLVSHDFVHVFKELVFWQIDRAYNQLQVLRAMLHPLMMV